VFKTAGSRRLAYGLGCFTAGWVIPGVIEWVGFQDYAVAVGVAIAALFLGSLTIAWLADHPWLNQWSASMSLDAAERLFRDGLEQIVRERARYEAEMRGGPGA
jgi:hypothetical protein